MRPSEWLPLVWGGHTPYFGDVDKHIAVIEAVLGRYDEFAATLNSEPPYLESIFRQAKEGLIIAKDWCECLMRARHLRTVAWDEMLKTEAGL